MFQINNIKKIYHSDGTATEVLKGVSLSVSAGEFVCIVGKSGSGKSSLLNIMSTLLRPDEGELIYKGIDLTKASSSKINDIRMNDFSIVFQSFQLFPYLTAAENVLLPYMHGLAPISAKTKELACEMLEKVGLKGKENRLPGKLSGGEQQRVAIARALIKKPALLFADEPTGSLDSKTGKDIIDLLKELNGNGLAVVMVTHSQEYARAGHTVISMEDGRVINVEDIKKAI